MEIKDPTNIEEVDPINSSIVVDDELYVFKENSVYRIMTAESIDPDHEHPETKHSYEKIFDIGSSSPYLARITIQFDEIIKFLSLSKEEHQNLLSFLWQANRYLLNAFVIDTSLVKDTTKLMPVCDKIIEENKNKSCIPAFPQIPDLEGNVRIYLNNAKLFLIESFRLLNVFYKMPFGGKNVAHFNSHLGWIEKNLWKEHHIAKMIARDLGWVRLISECRNALEHPEKGQEVKFKNLTLLPGNRFSGPAWSYDLTNKLKIKYDFVDLIHDLSVFSYNMFHFFEELFLFSVNEKLANNKILALAEIPEKDINLKCPIKYKVILREEYSKKI
jgi:hypothetical protein